jgi:hypothetical protein
MIDKSDKGDDLIQTVISISDFSKNYQSDKFKKWFAYLENILFNPYRSKSSPQWNMLIMINAYTVLFCFRSFIKTSIFPAGLISYPFKLPLSIILWLPYKIDKWLSITKSFILAYKTDKGIVRSFVESITARHKERKQGHESLRVSGLDSIIVEKNSDHLKYATMGITLSWSLTSSLFAKSGTTRTIIQYLMPFLNYRFLEENTLNYIRSRLEFAGFISAIDKEYQDEISYLKETLQRNKDYERTIWNEMGLIYTYLLDRERSI